MAKAFTLVYNTLMEILRTILLYAEGKDMPFVVIGGHAVNAYGISRQTGDLDLLVQRDQKEAWKELMIKLKYQQLQSDDFFARFQPSTIAAWPIDLMYVADETFQKMFTGASTESFGVVDVPVVSVRHLIMLKIHALKHYQEHRYAKDYNDVLQLLQVDGIEIEDDELRSWCQKYASEELYRKLVAERKRG